ncbi:MAG: M28 family peptidase [Candidatus Promineifilaceae bacterium]|nr:M28 family peptidase [Candidatus Promineifilaceae bacterium]
MPHRFRKLFWPLITLALLFLGACQSSTAPDTPTTTPSPEGLAVVSETATETPVAYLPPATSAPAAEPDAYPPADAQGGSEAAYPAGTGTATPAPMCTPPSCAEGEVYHCPGDCPGGCGTVCATPTPASQDGQELTFSGENAFTYLEDQMAFGPRYPGSQGHGAVSDYIIQQLQTLGWETEVQPLTYQGVQGRNVIGRANQGVGPIIILGAHYDTRRIAEHSADEEDRDDPVPGAVDGASGVAVLLELARTLDLEDVPREIWLAFFDMEDQGGGGMPGWEWIVGSTYMAENLTVTPEAMILVDMVGDADQQLYYEGHSDPALRRELWRIAGELGYGEAFIPEMKYTITDDHVPFTRRGIPAVDIIDFDYPYWHTVEDTADKASPDSLLRPGRTLEVWLEEHVE